MIPIIKRLSQIDSIRAIAILSVVMIHVSGAYAAGSSIAFYFNQLVRYAVPIFIILSGFSLYYADLNRAQDPCLIFYGKRLKKIFIPYVVWSLLFLLYFWATAGKSVSLLSIPKILLYGQASYHLYFIIIIMQLYLLYPLLRMLFKRFAGIITAITFIITIYYQTQIYLSALKIHLPVVHVIFDDYMVIFTWAFYFTLGMYLAKKPGIIQFSSKHRIWTVVVWIFSFGILILDSKITGTFDLSIRPSVMLFSVASFFFIYQVSDFIKRGLPVIEKMLGWVSDNSFFIYFSHAMILSAIIKYLKPGPVGVIFNGGPGMILLFIVTALLTFVLARVVAFIPFNVYLGLKGSKAKQ